MSRTLAALLLLCLVAAFPVAAETTALLETGPDIGRGLPYISANVIEYYEVTYTTAVPAGTARTVEPRSSAPTAGQMRVLYAATRVVAPAGWRPAACGVPGLLTIPVTPPALFYHSPGGYSLFFVYPADFRGVCSFARAFLNRFSYFLGITQDSALSSFPAVLQVP